LNLYFSFLYDLAVLLPVFQKKNSSTSLLTIVLPKKRDVVLPADGCVGASTGGRQLRAGTRSSCFEHAAALHSRQLARVPGFQLAQVGTAPSPMFFSSSTVQEENRMAGVGSGLRGMSFG